MDADLACRWLEALIAELSGGTPRHPGLPGAYVAGRYFEISEHIARDHLASFARFEPSHDRLPSHYALDVFALPGQTHPAQLALVAWLLQRLWRLGFPAGASAEYAGELPGPEEMPGRRHPRRIAAWAWEHEANEWA